MESNLNLPSLLNKFSNCVNILKFLTKFEGCRHLLQMVSKGTRECWLANECAFREAFNMGKHLYTEMQSLEEFTPTMGELMLDHDMYKQIKINIIL